MKRVLEVEDMGSVEIINAYNNLDTIDMVNQYFLNRALELSPSGKVLDIGCGTGKMLQNIFGNYERYGLDLSEELIAYAKHQDLDTNYTVGNANHLPYNSGSFDLVMCHSLLHHLENPNEAIKEIFRVSKPDGAIFIRDLVRPTSEEVLQRLYLGYLASHYDVQNKRLFENSLRSSLTLSEWRGLFPNNLVVSSLLFYNVAEKYPKNVLIDSTERKFRQIDFILRRLTKPLLY